MGQSHQRGTRVGDRRAAGFGDQAEVVAGERRCQQSR
jgi:hypothetical protein